MIRCPVCRIVYAANTVFCTECGAYLLEGKELDTDPIEIAQLNWPGEAEDTQDEDMDLPDSRSLIVNLRIGQGDQARELEVSLVKPIRLGRSDPVENIFPEVDLTDALGKEYGVSREHACIFQRDDAIRVEDLGSTNGTLLNGEPLTPYLARPLNDGDQLQLGKLLIEVSFVS